MCSRDRVEVAAGVRSKNRLLAAFLVLFIGVPYAATASAAMPPGGGGEISSLAPMLEKVTPAVVNIATEQRVRVQNPLLQDPFFRFFFDVPNQPLEQKTQSLGSGVIVDARRGLVITNNHVVANADQITVKLRDGRKLEAKRIGTDPETDVAVIKIAAQKLTEMTLADSDGLRVGDFVVAIGNPFGLGQTVTSGIVSALGRSGLGIEGYEDFIQTDASINPGNSGGALVDLRGRLVGINTAIFSQSGGNIGIGFAIPVNLAKQVMEQLVQSGEVKRGFLGAQLQDLDPDLAEAFGLPNQEGAVLVNILPDSPAQKAGLKPGDVVLAVNDKPVRNASALRNHVGLIPIGEEVTLEIARKGTFGRVGRQKITAVISEQKEAPSASAGVRNPRLAGATFGEIQEEAPAFGEVEGVMVVRVERGSRAWANGLRNGDIIDSVNQVPIGGMKEFLRMVNNQKGGLVLHVRRGNAAAFITMR